MLHHIPAGRGRKALRCVQDYIGGIRKAYEEDWYASQMRERQMAVALYFIDKLALRAGHEKDEDEADTVGCCTLKVTARAPTSALQTHPSVGHRFTACL